MSENHVRNSNIASGAIILYLLSGAEIGHTASLGGMSIVIENIVVLKVAALVVFAWFWYLYRLQRKMPFRRWRDQYWKWMAKEPVLLKHIDERSGTVLFDSVRNHEHVSSYKGVTEVIPIDAEFASLFGNHPSTKLNYRVIRFEVFDETGNSRISKDFDNSDNLSIVLPLTTYVKAKLHCLWRVLLTSNETNQSLVPWLLQWSAAALLVFDWVVCPPSSLVRTIFA